MKKLFLNALIVISTTIASAQTKINEGTITYDIQWILSPNANPQMVAMLPTQMKVYFKGDSSATVAQSAVSSSNTILNIKTEYFRLLLDIPMMQKKYSVSFTPADLEEIESKLPQFELTQGSETKTIAGYKAQRFTTKEKKSGQTYDTWITKDVSIVQNWLSRVFDNSHGVPLEFNTVQNGMGLKATVKEIKIESVPAGFFTAANDYEEITYKQLEGMSGRR